MIHIQKSTTIPTILVDKGVPTTIENCRLYLANAVDYDSGKSKLEMLSEIYGDSSVKQQLMLDQHDKCCFCEANITPNSYGDVEHFRPKAGFTKTRTEKLNRPGYYWLVYDWDNLFFSCQICNQRFKKNYFPLEDETKRAVNHTLDYREESPLLLHPSIDNPEDHITFNRHVPVPVSKSKRGEVSITSFGIDRPALNNVREAYLQNVRNNIAFAGVDLETITDLEREQLSHIMHRAWEDVLDLILKAKAFVAIAADDTQPFAAMVRANFPDLV
ncbi:hypothetical protein GCM10028808_23940 [Spirosoma migulaei]